jgi:transposase InsO family protein
MRKISMADIPDQVWWSAAELAEAGLPDVPNTKRGVNDMAKREGWDRQEGKVRRRKARGGGLEYHFTVLPMRARLKLTSFGQEEKSPRPTSEEAWATYEAAKTKAKATAEQRLKRIQELEALEMAGLTRNCAVTELARSSDASARTIWNWLGLIEGVAPEDRLAYLVPRHAGPKRAPIAVDDEFFRFFKSDYLRDKAITYTIAYDRAKRDAIQRGAPVPPLHQVKRKFQREVPKPIIILNREGAHALKRYFPYQDRTKTSMHALECVQADYHKLDLFAHWPGEPKPVRPQIVVFSDVYSGKILAWRMSLNPDSHTVRLAFGDLVTKYGIPKHALMDNGREFAAKILTGGAKTRFRFKIKEDEMIGLMIALGVEVHWASPAWGQAKPIERAFKDLEQDAGTDPAFDGAYTGNRPDAKPENYGTAAADLDELREVLEDYIQRQNAKPDRRSEVAFGKSFNQVFEESYRSAPIRKATAEQARLWLLAAEGVRAGNRNGEIKLFDSRFWAPWMHRIEGQKVVARFDPDNLHAGLHVYALDGAYLGEAAALVAGDFLSVEDAKDFARKRRAFEKATKKAAEAEDLMDASELAARLRAARGTQEEPPTPEAEVIQIVPAHPRAAKVKKPAETAPIERPAEVADLGKRRAQRAPETTENAFERALELEEQQAAGKPLTPAQADWLAQYQTSSEYRAKMDLRQIFGTSE